LHLSWREVPEFRESHHKGMPSILFRGNSRKLHNEFGSRGLAFEEVFSNAARNRPAVNPRYARRSGKSVRRSERIVFQCFIKRDESIASLAEHPHHFVKVIRVD